MPQAIDRPLIVATLEVGVVPVGGAAVEVTRGGEKVFEFRGTPSEVNTVQKRGRRRKGVPCVESRGG